MSILLFQNGLEFEASFSSSFCSELDAQMLIAMETLEKWPGSQKSQQMSLYLNSSLI